MEQLAPYDLVLTGGRIVDPQAGTTYAGDVAVRTGRIAAVGPGLGADAGSRIDLGGRFVAPGFVDLHGHYFASGSPIATEPDPFGVDVGVTTVVDAGTTGWANFPAFRALEMAQARTRVLAFLHVCSIGLQTLASGVGELHDLSLADVAGAVRRAAEFPNEVVGFKVRLTPRVQAPPMGVLSRGLDAAGRAGLPLMVHVTDPPVPVARIFERLRPGDIVTHALHGGAQGLLTSGGRPQPWFVEARERGVLFDVGHAGTLFCAETARRAADAGFWPDTLSTDAYRTGPGEWVPTLPELMSVFLTMGMPLERVVASVTTNCARALGDPHWATPWRPGAPADVTIFEVRDGVVPAGPDGPPGEGRQVTVVHVLRDGVLLPVGGKEATVDA
ncbi:MULTISPECIES: hypothetical protein [Micromonospora]|uniref:hypothetical protein n=1 Tax=Micromonospora TaxID=1873 RepID=UPI00069853A3|nr:MULTISPECIES: hypothetical protein [Micromonospora]